MPRTFNLAFGGGGVMDQEYIEAFKRLWPANSLSPVFPHVNGPRKKTLEKMRSDGLVKVSNRGYVLTPLGHTEANVLRINSWRDAKS